MILSIYRNPICVVSSDTLKNWLYVVYRFHSFPAFKIFWNIFSFLGSFVRRSTEECAKAKEEYYVEKYIDLLLGTNTATKKPKPLRGRARKPSVKFRTKEIKKKVFR